MRSKRSIFCLFLFPLLIFSFYFMAVEREEVFAEQVFKNRTTSLYQPRRGVSKKISEISGKIKIGHFLFGPDEEAELYKLKYSQESEKSTSADQFHIILGGKHELQESIFFWEARNFLHKNDSGWEAKINVDEAYINCPYNSELRWEAGKKILNWGKAHAWNPLGFLASPRDPLDPELSREFPQEGLIYLGAEYKKKFPPGPDPIQGLAFSPLIFPVQENVNETFGQPKDFQEHVSETTGQSKHWNLAGKLSLLFWNTEIDFCFLKGASRPDRYGFGFSRNLDSNLEIYGDFCMIPEYEKFFLDNLGTKPLPSTVYAAFGNLVGFSYNRGEDSRYIVEYYRNKAGYTPEEMKNYYAYLHEMNDPNQEDGDRTDIRNITEDYYNKPDLMQEYVFAKIIKNEPLEIQHLTFSVAGIMNLQDKSYSISPEFYYKSRPNLHIKLKATINEGKPLSEFGERVNDSKVEISLTYFFDFSFYQLLYSEETIQDSLSPWR